MSETAAGDLVSRWKLHRELVQAAMKREIANQLLFGYIDTVEELQCLTALAGIQVFPKAAMVLRVEKDGCDGNGLLAWRRQKACKRLEELLDNEQEALVAILGRDSLLVALTGEQDIVLLLPIMGVNRNEDAAIILKRYAKYIKAFIERDTDLSLRIGIGNCYDDFRRLRNSYREALDALGYSFYDCGRSIIDWADIHAMGANSQPFSLISYEAQLVEGLRTGDWDGFYRTSRRMVEEIAVQRAIPPEILKVRILELLTLLSRTAMDMGGDSGKLLDLKVRLGNELAGVDTIRALSGWLGDAFRDISWLVQQNQKDMAAKAVAKAKQYIHAHFARNISLEELAQHVCLSPYYLSHAFSEIGGVSITEYIKSVRINKAQRMLCITNRSITEIAASVGYTDPNYFTRVFKSITGKSPQQFRKGS